VLIYLTGRKKGSYQDFQSVFDKVKNIQTLLLTMLQVRAFRVQKHFFTLLEVTVPQQSARSPISFHHFHISAPSFSPEDEESRFLQKSRHHMQEDINNLTAQFLYKTHKNPVRNS
jgi:hypothetical protein